MKPLAELLLDHMLFFETCSDSECDEKFAVANLESISWRLKQKDAAQARQALRLVAEERLKDDPSGEIRSFLADFDDNFESSD